MSDLQNPSGMSAFGHILRTARSHFLLNFYAAVFHLLNHARRMAEAEGETLDTLFARFPFLLGYSTEMLRYMPEGMSWASAAGWWEREIAVWEGREAGHLPLLALHLPFASRLALMLTGLVEEDSRIGTLYAHFQAPLAQRRPCLEFVGQILGGDPWAVCRPLIAEGLIDVADCDAPRAEWTLRVPSALWGIARGDVEAQPTPWCRYHAPHAFPAFESLIAPDSFMERWRQAPELLASGIADALVLRASQGADRLQFVGAAARVLGRGVIEIVADDAGEHKTTLPTQHKLIGPLCAMLNALPVFTCDLGPGETFDVPPLAGYSGPIVLLMGVEGGLRGAAVERAISLTLPPLRIAQRRRCWRAAFEGHESDELEAIAERYHMPGGHIRQAASMALAHAALEGRTTVCMADVREACRTLNRQQLDTLATRLDADGSWDHLVVGEATADKIRELEQRCRHRERLLEHLGPAFGANHNRGVRALFTGPSGTGKTLAARILAAELGLDLYRVDLAAVVNKYIGETEKNLHRVLSRAEELDVILLLDEGDSLLGSRTEIRSANDRYANLETNYLLQRLEHYQGIVLVTTNAGESIDKAFQRRMDVVVQFTPPQAQERWHIWQIHLPQDHAVDDAFLEEVAIRCALTGGQIRNAALHATLLALDDGSERVTNAHIEAALQGEYRKAGATYPLNGHVAVDPGIDAFLNSFAR